MDSLDDFIKFAENSHILIADYESRRARLDAMLIIQKEEDSPFLQKWIADAHRRLNAMSKLYEYAKAARKMPLDELVATHAALRALQNS
jgi:hypothetical protein